MKEFNLVRYIVSTLLPLFVLVYVGDIYFLICVIALLYLNNVLDDIVFYYGSAFVKVHNKKGIPSPVEGTVTCIEKGVPYCNHITKTDILTKDELIKAGFEIPKGKYNHITIFLNKFNKHLVASLGNCQKIKQYICNDENAEMVCCGELIANNTGDYLKNTFVELKYPNNIRVVITMDKYISLGVVPQNKKAIEMLICRGSQCDIYVPTKYDVLVNLNDAVSVLQPLFNANRVYKFEDVSVFKQEVFSCIRSIGYNLKSALIENVVKTAKTYKHNIYILIAMLVLCALRPSISLFLLGVYIYIFLFDRSVKNGLYALMNIIGYKDWMTTIYYSLHKLLLYGK